MRLKSTLAVLMALIFLITNLFTVAFTTSVLTEETTPASEQGIPQATQTDHMDSGLVRKRDSIAHSSSTEKRENLAESQSQNDFRFDSLFEDVSSNNSERWRDLTYVDEDSVEIVIGIDYTQPESFVEINDLIAEKEGRLVNTISVKGEVIAVVADLPFDMAPSFVENVQASNFARYTELNMRHQIQLVPNDPFWEAQWGPQKIEADYAWDTTTGDPSVLVAVIDTGIDWDHPDLADNYVSLGYDWVNNDADPMDDYGHGTHCAGIIAATLNNSIGVAGLAQVRVMAEKGFDEYGWGYDDDLAKAIIHAVDQGADILSNSWGGYEDSALIHDAVKYANNAGVLVVASAGNEAWDVKSYPAAYEEVIAVTATDEFDNPAWFTNFGDWVELAAPGVNIFSTVWDDSYMYASGTSMSAPHVAGVAALIWSQFPDKTQDWVRAQLRYTADDLGAQGFDVYYGFGRINARRAVEEKPPAHDVMVLNWQIPPYVEPGGLATVNTTILNFGANDESDVTVQLLANGSIIDSKLIGSLTNGTSTTVTCFWNPAEKGFYNVTSYVVPLPGETITENNVISARIDVGFPLKVFVLDSAGTDLYTSTWEVLNTNWYTFGDKMIYIDYTTLNLDYVTYADIAATGADVLVISCAYYREYTDSEIEAITRYVHEGHGLIATAGTLYQGVPNNNKLSPLFGLDESVTWTVATTDLLHVLNTTHPVFVNVPDPFITMYERTALPSDSRWDSNELMGGTYLALGHYQESAIVAYRGLLYISPWLEIIPVYYHFNLQILYNAIVWSRYEKPEHELVASLDSPLTLKPGQSTLLNATVSNMGLSNETDVELFLYIDGVEVNSTIIPQLVNGTSYTITYLWTPTIETAYNITAHAPPVFGEDNVLNNVRSRRVIVSRLVVALFKNVDPWISPANEEALSLLGIPYIVFNSNDMGSVDLSVFTKVVVAADQDQTFYDDANTYRWWFEDYVSSGGVLEIHAADWGWHGGQWVGPLPGGIIWVPYGSDFVTIVDPTHPVVTTPNQITDAELDGWGASVHGYFGTYPADSRIVIIEDYSLSPTYLESEYGAGAIIAVAHTLEWAYQHQYSLILENSLLYTPTREQHDLTVFLEAPVFLELGESSLLNATVYNKGLSNETDVELELLIDGMLVNNVTIYELANGTYSTIDYFWTPDIEGVYNVTAYAPPVAGENVTANNVLTRLVNVRPVKGYVLFDQTHGTDSIGYYSTWVASLTYEGYVVDTLTTGPIIPEVFAEYDVFVIPQAWYYYSFDELSAIQDFVLNGGGLLVIGDDVAPIYDDLTRFAGIYWTGGGVAGVTYDITFHDVTANVDSVYLEAPIAKMIVEDPALDLVRDSGGGIMLAVSEMAGRVIGFADEGSLQDVGIDYEDNLKLANNMIDWLLGVIYEHELIVKLDAPRFLEPGDSTLLNATVYNRGLSNETDVELFLFIDSVEVNSTTVSQLINGTFYSITHVWTPSFGGAYNVTAYAPPVVGENVTANNVASINVKVSQYTTLSVQPLSNVAAVGETFSINITIADVTRMWGYEFILSYNTSVLTATSHISYDPFITQWFAEIDDKAGYVHLAYSMPLGDTEGFSTIDPAPIARIDFIVDDAGTSTLDLHDTMISDPDGKPIEHKTVSGYFTTNLAQTTVYVQPQKSLAAVGETFSINITIANVVNMWGYEFFLSYNTSIITATAYVSVDPFTFKWAAEIDDAAGYVYLSYSMPLGTNDGFSTIDPTPIARIDFIVDDAGTSTLDLHDVVVSDPQGTKIPVTLVDGFFEVTDVVPPQYTLAVLVTTGGTTYPPPGKYSIDEGTIVVVTAVPYGAYAFDHWELDGVNAGSANPTFIIMNADHTILAVFLEGVPAMSIDPTSGPIGTKVTVKGSGFSSYTQVVLTFDDQLMGLVYTDEYGNLTAIFNVPISSPGPHTVKVTIYYPVAYSVEEEFTVIEMTPLDVSVDVGEVHFAGESVTFYVQIAFIGEAVNATSIDSMLYKPDEATEALTTQFIVTGFYKIVYEVPGDAPTGTYTLVIDASYTTSTVESHGISIKSFLLSPSLTGWNALLININGTIGTIKSDLGLFEVKLDAINATLVNIEGRIATINSTIGLIQTDINTINARLTALNDTAATIQTRIGTITTNITDIQLQVTAINGNMATIQTTLDTLEGKIISIEGNMATIETDVGVVKADISAVKEAQEAFEPPIYVILIMMLVTAGGVILLAIYTRRKS